MEQRRQVFAARLSSFKPVAWELIPDLGLYMDQVMTFLERQCSGLYMEGERVFTPSMVNNYVKCGLVNRPIGKKYGREQLAQLLMICVLKQGASAEGMKQLLLPAEGQTIEDVYNGFCALEHEIFGELSENLASLPALNCALRGAAYHLVCNAVLCKPADRVKEDKPE